MNAVKKLVFVFIGILAMIVATAQPVSADVISSPAVTVAACPAITHTLRYGMYDNTTNGQVSMLQTFLHEKGYLNVTATGYFGPMTLQAVKAFQLASASGAVDGIVGAQTQAHIHATDCQTGTVNAPTISSLSPSFGPSGAAVTITGTGFTASNIVHFAVGGISNLPSTNNGTLITFTVPGSIGPYCKPNQACPMYAMLLTPGTYPLFVENSNGSSIAVPFTIVDNTVRLSQ